MLTDLPLTKAKKTQGEINMTKFNWVEGVIKPAKDVTEAYKEINEETEDRSFKKAVKSIQNKHKDCHWLRVQYENRPGNSIDRWVKIPMGRKKHLLR